MGIKYKTLKETKNLIYLWVQGILVGSKLIIEEDDKEYEKEVEKVLDYDSITHVFRIKFKDGDILNISDKDRYVVKIPINISNDIIHKPNKKRKKFKRKWKK